MSVPVQASGSQLTVIGTEHTLATIAVAGVFQLIVNGSPLAAGDTVQLRAKQKVAAGDANAMEVYLGEFADVQAQPVLVSMPVTNGLAVASAVEFSLKQTAGAVRTFDWRIDRIA